MLGERAIWQPGNLESPGLHDPIAGLPDRLTPDSPDCQIARLPNTKEKRA